MKKYQIYDGECSSLFADYLEFEAKNGKEAIMIYLKATNRGHYLLRRSKDNNVLFCATQYEERNGYKYKKGNAVWYKII